MYVDVVVDIESAGAPGVLTYLVPEALQASIGVGAYVRVPLGTREVLGYVVGLKPSFTGEGIKPITALVHTESLFDPPLLSLARWMTRRYFSSLSEVLRCIVPEGLATRLRTLVSLQDVPDPEAIAISFAKRAPVLSRLIHELAAQECTDLRVLRDSWEGSSLSSALSRLRARGWLQETVELESKPARAQKRRAFTAALPASALIAEAEARQKRAPAQAHALHFFAERGDSPLIAAEATAEGLSAAALRVLARDGLLQESSLTVRRDPWHGSKTRTTPPPLTVGQQHAVDVITETLATGQHDTILLHGVTASGKTEVYLHAIHESLARGRDAIVLLPEISLTAQVVDVFKSRLGDRVALLHSRLSAGERYDEWRRLRTGEAQVAVGPRSALFAPCRNPGLIILDEEHEPSYKQENDPRYHARRAARERAKLADAVLVLGSATPSVESYYLASTGEYRLVEMPERILGRALPKSTVVDLRTSGDKAKVEIFSEALMDGLADRLRRGEQSILFLNRRGFASFILCRECGYTAQCPHCSVALTLHVSDRSLR
ncbi:MAG TPA: primosomal protein N', partial [Armatimonadota bacterium]|nr:primosomal protein N' [Armatimonadota bacterium]